MQAAAIDGTKFKVVNIRDKNLTRTKMKRRLEQIHPCFMPFTRHAPSV